jgi:hypothetical protein
LNFHKTALPARRARHADIPVSMEKLFRKTGLLSGGRFAA